MLLTSFDPLAREFDRIAARAFGWAPSLVTQGMPMDAVRRENDLLLQFDLPGADPESIEVSVERGVLTVSAQRKEERPEGESHLIRERVMGTFTRRISLSEAADADHIEASYHDGVLTVRVPLAEKARPRKVAITTGGEKSLTR